MKLFKHKIPFGNIIITSRPAYGHTHGFRPSSYGYVVASFDSGHVGKMAYALFREGFTASTLTFGATPNSLFDEDTQTYLVGSADQLDDTTV